MSLFGANPSVQRRLARFPRNRSIWDLSRVVQQPSHDIDIYNRQKKPISDSSYLDRLSPTIRIVKVDIRNQSPHVAHIRLPEDLGWFEAPFRFVFLL
jgi:hypothetical protein